MPRKKTFENTIVFKPLITRTSGVGKNRVDSKTITVPKRYLEEWQADKTLTSGEEVALIPLGNENAKYGFLVLPVDSPIVVVPKNVASEVRYFENVLERVYDDSLRTFQEIFSHHEDYPKDKILTPEGVKNILDYLKRIDFTKKYARYIPEFAILPKPRSPHEKKIKNPNFTRKKKSK